MENVNCETSLNRNKPFLKPWSNELDFSQYNMQHLSSGKSCDRLTRLVYTCRDRSQHVVCCRRKFDRDKKCCIDKCCATIHFFCFCSSRLVWNKCHGKMFGALDHAKTKQHATMCNRMSDKCCMLYSKSRAHLTGALVF